MTNVPDSGRNRDEFDAHDRYALRIRVVLPGRRERLPPSVEHPPKGTRYPGHKLLSMGVSDIIGIDEELLEFVIEASQSNHPDEFFSYLRARPAEEVGLDDKEGKVLTEALLMTATEATSFSAETPDYTVPVGGRADGSAHSHPNGILEPSEADVHHFEPGNVHIIVGAPYDLNSWRAFDADGNLISLPVLDADIPELDEEW